jgi:hypothetical protein
MTSFTIRAVSKRTTALRHLDRAGGGSRASAMPRSGSPAPRGTQGTTRTTLSRRCVGSTATLTVVAASLLAAISEDRSVRVPWARLPYRRRQQRAAHVRRPGDRGTGGVAGRESPTAMRGCRRTPHVAVECCAPGSGRRYVLLPAMSISATTRSGVRGSCSTRVPPSASATAFRTAAGAAIVPPSPTPR